MKHQTKTQLSITHAPEKCVLFASASKRNPDKRNLLLDFLIICSWTAEKRGFEIVEEFQTTLAADQGEKPLKEMLKFLKQNPSVSKVIALSLDQFSQNHAQALKMVANLEKSGLEILTTQAPKPYAIETLFPGLNAVYSKPKTKWRDTGIIHRLKKGYYTGKAPYGYKNIRSEGIPTIEPDGLISKHIQQAFTWRAEGKLTQKQICSQLRAQGWKIYPAKLSRIMKSPIYCGMLTHRLLGNTAVLGNYQALVSFDIFKTVNNI